MGVAPNFVCGSSDLTGRRVHAGTRKFTPLPSSLDPFWTRSPGTHRSASAHLGGPDLGRAAIDRHDRELPRLLHRQLAQVVHDGLPLLDLADTVLAGSSGDARLVHRA